MPADGRAPHDPAGAPQRECGPSIRPRNGIEPMNSSTQRLETLIVRVSLWLLLFFSLISIVAIAFVAQHGRPGDQAMRLAIPVSTIVACMLAFILLRHGRARLGIGIVLLAAYGSIVFYVVVGGYGLHSYLLSMFAVLIVITSLLIGRRAGLWATAVALATAGTLFALERNGLVMDPQAILTIPLNNIMVVYGVAFASTGSVLYVYSTIFQETLRAVDQQERRMRQVIEVAPLGQVVHRDHRILMINKVAAAIIGRDAEALTGLDIEAFVSQAQRANLKENMVAALSLAPGKNVVAEYRIIDGHGRERLCETLTSPVDFVDGPALLTVMRDVTHERAAAAALFEAKSDAESANRTKSQFLANMSHEIRTPMNAVLGLSELLVDSGLSGVQLRYARNIHNAAGSLLDIINDVLDVSRIEAGHLELASARFEPRALLARVHAMLLPLAEAKGLILEGGVDDRVPTVVLGDEGRVRQILVNLAGNAIKFTQRGRVGIEMRGGPGGDAGEAALQIIVTDSGVGIAHDKQSALFKPFVQVDNSDTRRHGGTGLGLYIVRELAQRMGGDVSVHSAPGAGSTFEVRVRLKAPPQGEPALTSQPPPESTDQPAPEGRSMSVLLVEDNEINRMVARAILEGAGHRVSEATDGAQAVAIHAAQPFDCVLMDCQMPVMDGLDATRHMRERETAQARRRTPIIALTANAMQGDRERCLAAGMDDFLAKPYDIEALLTVLERATTAPEATAVEACFDARGLDELMRLERDLPGLLGNLVRRFLGSTPALIARITGDEPASAKDMEIAAHSLKSTCARFGAMRVAALAAQAEQAARDGLLPEAQRLGAAIRGEFDRFEAEFKRHPAVTAATG